MSCWFNRFYGMAFGIINKSLKKIIDIPYGSIITEGIKGIYNWVKTCEGCKKEFDADYPFDDCEICGSKVFKRRIKTY